MKRYLKLTLISLGLATLATTSAAIGYELGVRTATPYITECHERVAEILDDFDACMVGVEYLLELCGIDNA